MVKEDINKRNYVVYLHVVPKELSDYDHDKYYVGITGKELDKRFLHGRGYRYCTLFNRAINKYGWDNIIHLTLKDNLTEYEAKEMEKLIIKELKANDPQYGYNMTEGGDGMCGYKHTDETKRKISEKCKGHIPPCKGKPISKEHSDKLKQSWIKRKERGGELGTKKPVIVYPINKQYDSLIEACKDLNINYGSAINVVNGRRNSVYGYVFHYVGGYINQIKEAS